jgi:hypothetical protein
MDVLVFNVDYVILLKHAKTAARAAVPNLLFIYLYLYICLGFFQNIMCYKDLIQSALMVIFYSYQQNYELFYHYYDILVS